MGHAQSKRKKQRQGRARRRIEHVTHEQTRYSLQNQENQTSRTELQRNERRSAGKSGRWREPSPEKIDTLERRQREAVNRTKRNRSHSRDSRGRSPKRHSRSNLENSKTQLQPQKMSSEKFQTLAQRNSEAQRGRNFSRRSGTWFCVVRCRSEPPLDRQSKVNLRAPRKSASASPPRKVRRELELAPFYQNGLKPFESQKQQFKKPSNVVQNHPRKSAESSATAVPARMTNYREEEGLARVDRSFQPRDGTENVISAAQHDEIGISFEQVEPKLFRLFGSSAKSGPIPQTNRVAPRALRRSFPNLTSQTSRKEHDLKPKQNFISRTAKDKSVSETRLQKLAAQHFPKPPIPPRKQKLSELAHLVQQTSPKLTKHEPAYQQQANINHNNQNHNYGSVETLNSLSSQSGSYHLPSSANFSTLPDRSLAESPHAVHLSDSAKISAYSDDSEEGDDDDDALQIRTIPQIPPLTVAEKNNDPGESRYSPEIGRKNLLWSNPAPFGSQPLQRVIRSVQAPIQKPQNLHWPPVNEFKPVQKFTPAGRYQKNSINSPPPVPLRPPQINHQRNGLHEFSVSPERLRPSTVARERPRSEVQDRVYKDIIFDNTERSSNLIKSGLPKTLRPSIEDLVSILAEPIPPRSKKSHRFQSSDFPSEENLINELKTEKKRPGILKNANTHTSSRVVEVLYHEPKSRKTPIHQNDSSRWSAPYDPPIFLGEDDFGNNWIDLTQPARNSYLNDDY
ncbi:Oidioi.mRNA.OKI2018_I69.chr2.g4396.t1.cds [Oikopleura dioica]|uniref:Oidioi.mRNA.OKI2018_I69.chr2.g4396.t1.cds n=1 Tax=Oikopleura dioica TaxID=34765 RepID=A0ABN7T2S7_OIKDI|nr:Oidioi.mRNA.OKI2018_I69.chr2.g4396.t1.cds [Oikopleura dioica]